uniref:GH18 domain-containing protein n=1 Tax=Leersia perrieri TaxID=77586 RepID=A0A0D9VUH0_9ORYZ
MASPQRRRASLLLAIVLSCVISFTILAAPAAGGKTGELAVFWGRNADEGSLREACDTGIYNTVIISFLAVFGHGNYGLDISGHRPLAADIKHCQKAKNVTVLLSIGGDGDHYSIPTPKSARDVADHLWHAYLAGGRRSVLRPFGDAVLDGVDLYIDHGGSANYDVLVRRLAGYSNGDGGGKRRPVILTATVKCMDGQETSGEEAVAATGLIGRIHVRFYGDRMCSYESSERRPFYGSWLGWTARYTNTSVYVGLPAAWNAASDGWIDPAEMVSHALPLVQGTANYGGVMLWNRYFDRRSRYGVAIKAMV